MSAGGSAPLWRILLFVFSLLVSSVSVQKHFRAESGHSVTLLCRAPNDDITITAVEWTRTDLKNEYVFFYRNKGFDPANQHLSFKNRVDLQDRQMKDGDVSLILKDVTTADSGTYECRVAQRKTNEEIASLNLISSIDLSVFVPPGHTGGDTEDGGKEAGGKEAGVGRGHLWLVASGLLLVGLIVALVMVQKCQR